VGSCRVGLWGHGAMGLWGCEAMDRGIGAFHIASWLADVVGGHSKAAACHGAVRRTKPEAAGQGPNTRTG
jgi:hypothetical protein